MLQIQPSYHEKEKWAGLAARHSFVFETHELTRIRATESAEELERCLGWYSSCGITESVHGAYIDVNPFSADRDFALLSQKRVHESCAMAVQVHASNIVFHCSCFPFLRGDYLVRHAELAASFYTEIAEQYGLRVFLENSFDLDPDPISAIMKHADPRYVNCCLDVGHANYSRVPPEKWFDALGDRIGYLHLSDNHGAFDEHLPLGAGSIPWGTIDRLYRGLNKNIPVTLETGNLENTERSIRFLSENGYFI